MKLMLVEERSAGLKGFGAECRGLPQIELSGTFEKPSEALDFAAYAPVEVAVLEAELPERNSFALVKQLRERIPKLIIILVTSRMDYAAQAVIEKCDHVVFRPYVRADVIDAISRAKLLLPRLNKRMRCLTFGRFDVFIDGRPVHFRQAKAKELLAFCVVRRGAPVATEEIIDKLWPEYTGIAGDCSIFRTTAKALKDVLCAYDMEELFVRERGMCRVNTDLIDCDYYDVLHGDRTAWCSYQHEFLLDYEWGTTFAAALDEMKALLMGYDSANDDF